MDTIQEKELNEEKKQTKKKNAWEKRKEMNAREKKEEEEVEFAFVLCLPYVFRQYAVGLVLKEFTQIGLKLLE